MPFPLKPKVQEALYQCSLASSRVHSKVAFGGDGQDSNFESAFAALAHTFVQEEAPTLQDYELGFQLIDRNKEGDRAVGVTVFKVGKQTIQAPLFFLKGQLRGNELLWMQEQDLFVPLKESWVNYVINRAPAEVGHGVPQSERRKHKMRQPDLSQLAGSPMKYSKEIQAFRGKFAVACSEPLSEAASRSAGILQKCMGLENFLKTAGIPQLKYCARLAQANMKIAETFDAVVGLDKLLGWIKSARTRAGRISLLDESGNVKSASTGRLTGSLLGTTTSRLRQTLRVAPRTKLGSVIDAQNPYAEYTLHDTREEQDISRAFRIKLASRLTNPPRSGVYDVLVGPGEFAECAVINNPHTDDRNLAATSLVIELGGDKRHRLINTSEVFIDAEIKDADQLGDKRWKKWVEGLPTVSSSVGESTFAIVSDKGHGTVPMHAFERSGDIWAVHTRDNVDIAADYDRRRENRHQDNVYSQTGSPWETRLHLNGRAGSAMVARDGDIYIPQGCKMVTLSGSQNKTFVYRALDVTQQDFLTKTAEFCVQFGGGMFSLNGQEIGMEPAARLNLIFGHGLSEAASNDLLKEARESHSREARCHVKYASPWIADESRTNVPFPNLEQMVGEVAGIPTERGVSQTEVINDLSAVNGRDWESMSGDDYYPSPQSVNEVHQAASSGKKEVFETSVMKQMIQSTNDSRLFEQNLPGMVTGMDSFGDTLFRFYAHQERFGDRYGTQDLPELEDGLRNSFEKSGDTVIFLKQKTIQSRPDIDMRDLNLQDAAADF